MKQQDPQYKDQWLALFLKEIINKTIRIMFFFYYYPQYKDQWLALYLEEIINKTIYGSCFFFLDQNLVRALEKKKIERKREKARRRKKKKVQVYCRPLN